MAACATWPRSASSAGPGFYEFLDVADEVAVETPFGPPSDPLVIGEVAGRRVAFVPRHGRDHRFPPHKIPYRANLWALRSVGVRQILGAERRRLADAPSSAPAPWSCPTRSWTGPGAERRPFYDAGGAVVTSRSPTPTAPSAAATRRGRCGRDGLGAGRDGGTLVVIDGPRFSTRAESLLVRRGRAGRWSA